MTKYYFKGMNLLQQTRVAIDGYKQAHRFVWQNKLYVYMIVPIVLNVALFLLINTIGWQYAGELTNWLLGLIGVADADWGTFDFLRSVIQFILAVILRLMVLLVYMASFKYIVLVLLAPVLALLSEKVEEIKTGKKYPFSFPQLFKDVFRGVIVAIRNGAIELMLTIVLFALSFVPVVGLVSPVLAFIMESYFFGFSMYDYYGERQRWTATQSSRVIWRYKAMVTTNGMVFNGLLLLGSLLASIFPFLLGVFLKIVFIVPVIGLSIAPIYSVVAATLNFVEIPESEKQPIAHGQ